MAHYYVLSRFLISRMLTVTKVPQQKAVKIALDVKKYLVDNDRLDIPQARGGRSRELNLQAVPLLCITFPLCSCKAWAWKEPCSPQVPSSTVRHLLVQAELETIMFSVMRSKGFGDEYINRYKMVNQFFQQKRPLIILICGSACTGEQGPATSSV